jgi:hypothetical protein
MKRRVRGVGIVLCVIAVSSLFGCQAVPRVSAELKNGDVRFVYCDAYAATEVQVWDWSKSRVVWRASGTTPLRAGQVVTYGVAPKGFHTTKGPASLDLSHSLEVDYIDPSPSAKGPYMTGIFDGSKLVEGKWLNWNDRLVAKPCDE